MLDSQLDIDFDGKYNEDTVSHLDAAHQHQRGGGGEELPVDEAGDEEEEAYRHSAGNPTTPSVGEKKSSLNSLKIDRKTVRDLAPFLGGIGPLLLCHLQHGGLALRLS